MPSIDLFYAMDMPHEKAVAYFKSKGYAIGWDYEDIWKQAQTEAFTVAKVTKLDLLEDIRGALQTALDEGKTAQWFANELAPVLQKKGWWGVQDLPNPDGVIENVQLGSLQRLDLIYRQNLQTAYMAGRREEQLANVDDRPYWQYVAIMDRRGRKEHKALNGLTFPFDDPFWQKFYPPNGWRCRCRVRALSADNLKDRKIDIRSSEGKLGTRQALVSVKSGELRPVATYQTIYRGKALSVSPDVGWDYPPGRPAQPAAKYGGPLKDLAKRELK
jgi:SPP1 gp7 family putative phage head morphogenesis protein